MILSRKASLRGTTLLEASIAACTAALFLGSLFTLNMAAMKSMRTAREAAAASQVLQQRIESMRIANWHQITDADWLSSNLLNANASGSGTLNGVSESLTLMPYGSTNVGNTQLVRANGTTQIVSRNTNLLTESAVKLLWTVSYTGGINSQSTTRQTVAILAKGGVAKW